MSESPRRHDFLMETRQLFGAVIVIYSGVFQKNTKFERIRSAGLEAFGSDHIYSAYQRVWKTLPDFCKLITANNDGTGMGLTYPPDQQVLREVSPTDEPFKAYIIIKERDFLAKRRAARK